MSLRSALKASSAFILSVVVVVGAVAGLKAALASPPFSHNHLHTAKAAAAAENERLSLQLAWILGGAAQHGWSIYTP